MLFELENSVYYLTSKGILYEISKDLSVSTLIMDNVEEMLVGHYGEIAVIKTYDGRIMICGSFGYMTNSFEDITDLLVKGIDGVIRSVSFTYEPQVIYLCLITCRSVYLFPIIDKFSASKITNISPLLVETFDSKIKFLQQCINKANIIQTEDGLLHAINLMRKPGSPIKITTFDISFDINSSIKKILFEDRTLMVLLDDGSAYIFYQDNNNLEYNIYFDSKIKIDKVLLETDNQYIIDIIFVKYRGYFIQTADGKLFCHSDRGLYRRVDEKITSIDVLNGKFVERIWAVNQRSIIIQYDRGQKMIMNIKLEKYQLGQLSFGLEKDPIQLDYFNNMNIKQVSLFRDDIYVLIDDGRTFLIETKQCGYSIEGIKDVKEMKTIPLDSLCFSPMIKSARKA